MNAKSIDVLINGFDKALRVVTDVTFALRPSPAMGVAEGALDVTERRHSVGLMRVNHVGEVCAQALYDAQSQFARSNSLRLQFAQAGREEQDHLAWTAWRLQELGSQPSVLNPLWYAGAYALGAMAACLGDTHNLGFVVETERQVEAHLTNHLKCLPLHDAKSRAIVEKMRADEAAHGVAAQSLGAADIPVPIKKIMESMAKIMTTTAYFV